MQTIELTGTWLLYYGLETDDNPVDLADVIRRGWPCLKATVPGNVEIDLAAAGVIGDPFFDNNMYDLRPYEFYQWWYTRTFNCPDISPAETVVLELDGIDTYATVWINGQLIGQTDNMLIGYRLTLPGLLCKDENQITIRLASALNVARQADYPVAVKGAGWEYTDELVRLRKAAHSFGWDIAPRIVSAGIWKPLRLSVRPKTRIDELYAVTTDLLPDGSAVLLFRYRLTSHDPLLDGLTLTIAGRCGDRCFSKTHPVRFVSGEMTIRVPDPCLWWPAGYGDPALYQITCTLSHHGELAAEKSLRMGIRLAEVETRFVSGDAGQFLVRVNRQPILCKGTNWVPLDALHSRDISRLATAHALLADAGCNIVRCWGGNVYESDTFFDLCDEKGILVWQDFSFACAFYPQDDTFAATVQAEASVVIGRLRNHPSLLLWCGDNEIDMMHQYGGYPHEHARYNRLSREVLAAMTAAHDPYRTYLPSSPYLPADAKSDLDVPEQHNWGPRDYFKSDFYRHSSAHFISEIGYHGCPSATSVRRFLSPEHVWPMHNDAWTTHSTENLMAPENRGYDRNRLMANQVICLFGEMPGTLEDFAMASQISQAEAVKFFIERVRMKKWRTSGVIWWNLLDCWPQFSDAVVDYYFVRKLAWYYIQRVQQPICLMFSEAENWEHTLILGNDSLTGDDVSYEVEDTETGVIVLQGQARSIANTNIRLGAVRAYLGKPRLYLISWQLAGKPGVRFGNHYLAGFPPFDLPTCRQWLDRIAHNGPVFAPSGCWQ